MNEDWNLKGFIDEPWFEWIENHKNCRGKPFVDGGGGMAGAELRCIGGSDYPFKHT